MKKIAIVHDFLIDFGGAEKVVIALLNIYPDADFVTTVNWLEENEEIKSVLKGRTVKLSRLNTLKGIFQKRWKFLLPFFAGFFQKLDLKEYDTVISVSSSFSKWLNLDKSTKHISYINTPPRFIWGYESSTFDKLPALTKSLLSLFTNRWKEKDLAYSQKVDKLIANSKNIQKKIKESYKLSSQVIHPPVIVNNLEHYQIEDEGFYLIINRLVNYKHIDKIIKSFKNSNRKLVIIGKGPEEKYLKSISGRNIHFTGFLDDITKLSYLSKCKALIYPGEEDFGIVMVEALMMKKPVIAFEGGGALEIVDDKVGELFKDYKRTTLKKTYEKIENKKFKESDFIKQSSKFGYNVFRTKFLKLSEDDKKK